MVDRVQSGWHDPMPWTGRALRTLRMEPRAPVSEYRNPMAPPGPTFDIAALQRAVWRGKWVIAISVVAAVLVALVATLLTPKQYQAVAVVQLLPRAGKEVELDQVVKFDEGGYMEMRERARTQLQIIQSRSIRQEVAKRYEALGLTPVDPVINATADGVGALKEALSAGPREDTQLVEIRVMHADPERAAVLANLVAQVYWERNLAVRQDVAKDTREWLQGQADGYANALTDASARVLAFKKQNDVADIDQKVTDVTARLDALQKARGEATTQRVLVEGRLREHEALLRKGEIEVLAGMFDDPTLTAMSRELGAIRTRSAEVLARYGEKHPEHQQVVAHVARVEALLATEVERNVAAERAQVETLKRQERQLDAELEQVKAELLDKQALAESYALLKADEDRARRLYGSLGERGAEVDLQARTQLNDVRILDKAVAPGRPAKPNKVLNLAMALGAGFVGGLGLALIRARLDDTFIDAQEVESHLGLPVVGILPSLPGDISERDRPLYTVERPRSLAAESIRGVRSALREYVVVEPARRLLVTSTIDGEGKSHVAVSLAAAFARMGAKTLLIDGDLRRSRLHAVFGLERKPGLTDSLGKGLDPATVVQETSIERLSLLAAGKRVDNPNELLSSPRLLKLLDHLAQDYNVIVIDSPPTALVADSLALGRGADGTLFVARRGRVGREVAARAVMQLKQAGVRMAGVVLNDVPPEEDRLRYGNKYYDDTPRTPPTRSSKDA